MKTPQKWLGGIGKRVNEMEKGEEKEEKENGDMNKGDSRKSWWGM